MFSGIERWKEFFSRFPNKAFICEVRVVEPFTEEHYIWFYVKKILPAIQEREIELGNYKSLQDIDLDLRMLTMILYEDESQDYKQLFDFDTWKPIFDCNETEVVTYIELVLKYCAEVLELIIQREL